MSKKVIFIILTVVIAALIIVSYTLIKQNKELKKPEEPNNQTIKEEVGNNMNEEITKESIVLYFSATGNTKNVAETISKVTNSDILEIIPKEKYTTEDLSYNNDNCRANKEQSDENARPEIENISSIDKYDIIYLGYPIWWGDVPKVILTFLDNYNLDNKTIIPFCTSGSSSISKSTNTLKAYNENVNWLDGKRFNSPASENEIEEWVNELNILKPNTNINETEESK